MNAARSDLEARLRAAGDDWAAEPVPDLATPVLLRLSADAAVSRPAIRRRAVLVAVAAALALLVAVPLLVPSVGSAVARYLGVGGLRVQVAPELPEVDGALRLGRRSDLARAREAVAFPVGVPAALGEPDAVWLDLGAVPGGQVTMLWRPGAGLPAAEPYQVGALLTALPGRLEPGLLAKTVAHPGTTLTSVSVGDGDGAGWWIGGAPHALTYFDAEGRVRSEPSRLAGATLLWQSGDTLYRLESALPMEGALRIARSLP